MFRVALFTIAKTWKKPKYPLMDNWPKKTAYIYGNITQPQKRMKYYYLQQHGWIQKLSF